MPNTGITSPFAVLIGFVLLAEGIWGFFSPVVFGILSTNPLHALIHVVLGIAGLLTGLRDGSRGYCFFTGGLLLLVGALRFVPGADEVVVDLLNVNPTVGYINVVIGVVLLGAAVAARPKPMPRPGFRKSALDSRNPGTDSRHGRLTR